jgi:hypothetical protein
LLESERLISAVEGRDVNGALNDCFEPS